MPSRLSLSASDVAWLSGQVVLFVLAFVVLPSLDGGPGRIDIPGSRPAGLALMASGAVVLVAAFLRLGRKLVPQPTPVADGQLIQTGLYGIVRHPIYLGVLLLILGGLLRTPSISGLVVVAASVAFFDAKSAHEERLLEQTYDDYDAYRERVRHKLIPGVI